MKTPWDRYNKTIVAINDIDIATQDETDEECLRLAEAGKEHLRGLADHYLSLTTKATLEAEPCPRARPGRRRCPKCRPLNEPPRCTQRNIGMKSNRCALPKNHGGACRAPRTGDRIRWKKLGIYEKDWPK